MKKKIVVLSGAGISAESGIKTFRDSDGLWEQYDVMTVASIEGWFKNPQLVTDFYNQRRVQLATCEPNLGHWGLAELEKEFDVEIITQNIDDLHERAGSTKILHLHGELVKVRSTTNDSLITNIGYSEMTFGEKATDGSLLRPHVVWFGEAVPLLDSAIKITKSADIFIIIGTSLNVYPAAGLVHYVPVDAPIYLIDPSDVSSKRVTKHITKTASEGVKELQNILGNE